MPRGRCLRATCLPGTLPGRSSYAEPVRCRIDSWRITQSRSARGGARRFPNCENYTHSPRALQRVDIRAPTGRLTTAPAGSTHPTPAPRSLWRHAPSTACDLAANTPRSPESLRQQMRPYRCRRALGRTVMWAANHDRWENLPVESDCDRQLSVLQCPPKVGAPGWGCRKIPRGLGRISLLDLSAALGV